MTYAEWFESHAKRHKEVVTKLLEKGYDKAAIIAYFDFDNMVQAEPDFCPLYRERKKCHDMKRLNCYLCACPHFRFNDEGIGSSSTLHPPSALEEVPLRRSIQYSTCAIDAKAGAKYVSDDAIHQDCSQCTLPHLSGFIDKHFDIDWQQIMRLCPH